MTVDEYQGGDSNTADDPPCAEQTRRRRKSAVGKHCKRQAADK